MSKIRNDKEMDSEVFQSLEMLKDTSKENDDYILFV